MINTNGSFLGLSPNVAMNQNDFVETACPDSTRHKHRDTCGTMCHILTPLWCCESSGQAALRPFGNGGAAAATLAKLHSGLLSQFLNLFVPYVKRLTEAVKARGVRLYAILKLALKQHVAQLVGSGGEGGGVLLCCSAVRPMTTHPCRDGPLVNRG